MHIAQGAHKLVIDITVESAGEGTLCKCAQGDTTQLDGSGNDIHKKGYESL